MESKYTLQKATEILMKQCSVSEKCSSDIYKKLKLWGFDDTIAKNTVQMLQRERFLDDERFARAYIRDKFRFNGWGQNKISMMLSAKYIDRDLIRKCLAEELNSDQQDTKCYELLKKKMSSVKYKDKYDLRNKLFAFGVGRGFDFEILNKHISNLIGEFE